MARPFAPTLSRMLTRMNMLVSGAALVCSCLALGAYDLVTFRYALEQQLSIQAQIAGANSISALIFDDAAAAERTLRSLRAAPEIVSAQVYTSEGRLFADYRRDATVASLPSFALPAGIPEAHLFTSASVTVARRIEDDGRLIGTIYIASTLDAIYQRFRRSLVIVTLVLLVSLFAAFVVSRRGQRAISAPLAALGEAAGKVADDEGYAVRVERPRGAPVEISRAVDAFNEMLGRIESRDLALEQARDELEARVRLRTEELDATNRELESFSYSVSHDLRAPLRHVVGFANLLDQHAASSLDEKGRGYLRTISEAATRMGRLIDDLLAFSRTGRTNLSPKPVSLTALVQDARAEVSADAAGRAIVWDVPELPIVQADPALLRLVLVNLLSNAVKYSGPREVAHIAVGATQPSAGEVVVFVKDNGVGFDMQYAPKLFGVFQRLHRSDEFSGTGIGLANVRRIIARHGGRTWAEAAPDAGATFYFSLPVHTGTKDEGEAILAAAS